MNISRQFSKFIFELEYNELPQETIIKAKERILDNLGAAVAGCISWTYREPFLAACKLLGEGSCGVIGDSEKKYPMARAAMINATYAEANELDDGHIFASVHAGCVVVSTALVMGAELHCSGRDIITSVVAGYEIVYRLGVAMCPHLIVKGFHPSSVLNTCGAVAVAGKLLGLNEEQLANALGMAGMYGNGLMEATITGQQTKCIMVGNAAATGIMAVLFAKNGLPGALSVFEGQKGLFNTMSRDVDRDSVCQKLGKVFSIGDTYNKLYPTCRHGQAGIEASLILHEEHDFMPDEIDSIHVGTYQIGVQLTGTIYEPKDQGEAKYSMPYGIALVLTYGAIAPLYLNEEYYTKPELLSLAKKVTVSPDDSIQREYPRKRGARVRIQMKNGMFFEKTLFSLRGSPEVPVGWDVLEKKFVANCTPFLGNNEAKNMGLQIQSLESESDISDIYKKLCI